MIKLTLLFCLLTSFDFITGDECYTKFEKYKAKLCSSIKLQEEYRHCYYINDQCIQLESKCSDYKGDNKEICEAIIGSPIDSEKCIFKNNTCQSRPRLCSDYNPEEEEKDYCEKTKYLNGYCEIDLNGECKEVYHSCEIAKEQKLCESIYLADYLKKCSWINDKCEEIAAKSCSDLNSISCGYFYFKPEDEQKKCVFENNKCLEVYKECSYYKGNDPKICESINPTRFYDTPYKCIFKDNECIKEKKTCSEVSEIDDCSLVILDDNYKYCTIENGKCTEHYKECYYYNGTDAKECEKNIPVDRYGGIFGLTPIKRKCVFNGISCDSKDRDSCSDYQKGEYDSYCDKIEHKNEHKYCKFMNGECKEFYKWCYRAKSRSECVSNIPRWVDVACKISSFGICISISDNEMSCSLFPEFIDIKECESIVPLNINKKCVFSNNSCYEEDKKSLDYKTGETNEILENDTTSTNSKKSLLNENKDGCKEDDYNQTSLNENKAKNETEDISSGENFLQLGIGLYIILFLFKFD